MTCSKYPPLLSRFLDRELSSAEMAEVADHLSRCEDCRALQRDWQLQSAALRAHLSRHRLGDDFVKKVMVALPTAPRGTAFPARVTSDRRRFRRWLPAAAAVALAAVAINLYLSNRNAVGYARVIEPGELEVLQSGDWKRATAGELLHPGEWLRNPMQGAPEIMWKDTCRFTVQAGTLAHIPDGQARTPEQLFLLRGALSSEVQEASHDFQVSTPAGSVTSSMGRFTVRVTDHALPQITVAADGAITLTGTVVPIGEVRVDNGRAVIQAQVTREVPAGTTAVFSKSDFSGAVSPSRAVEASLRAIPKTPEQGSIRASFTASAESAWISVEASNISLRKLLAWATASEVRGGDDIKVSGHLRVPLHSGPESVASAVASTLGLPVSYRQERGNQMIAVGHLTPSMTPDGVPGEFTLDRSSDGRVTFDFRSVPAGQVFSILRSAEVLLPELAPETAAMSVSIRASGLSTEETSTWIGKALGLELKMADHTTGLIEIGSAGSASPGTGTAAPGLQRFPVPQTSPIDDPTTEQGRLHAGGFSADTESLTSTAYLAAVSGISPQTSIIRPLWSVIDPRMRIAGFYAPATATNGNQSAATGKSSPKKLQFYGAAELLGNYGPSTHLIWPTLELENAQDAEAAYLVSNPMNLTAHSLWRGYDQAGQLVAEYTIPLSGSSTLAVLPNRDLPSFLGAGGHWETFSDLPLAGARETESGNGLGWPAGSEQLNRRWAFPSASLDLGVRLWLVNPNRERASVVLLMMKHGTAVATELLHLGPHEGLIWPEAGSSIGTGFTVRVSVTEGTAATGLK